MKRPSFQFYPADWRKDANLRRCSPAARGVWMDVLCVLHDSDEYGVVHWPLKELASAAGASLTYLRELAEKRVLKGCDKGECEPLIFTPRHGRKLGDPVTLVRVQAGPIWYSARFVRDEYVRTIRGESSRFGEGNGETPNAAPKPPIGDGSTSSASSSPAGSSEANASAATAAGGKSPEELTKLELWRAGKSLLREAGVPEDQCGSFVGRLVAQYTDAVVIEAVRSAVVHTPADPREYLVAACQRIAGERTANAITVPSKAADQTAEYLAAKEAEAKAAAAPEAHAAREAAMARLGRNGHGKAAA